LKVGQSGYGLLMAAAGVGALLGALNLAFQSGRSGIRRGCIILIGSSLFSLALCGFALSPVFILSLGMLVAVGWAMISQNATTNMVIQTTTPDHLRGRVMSVYALLFLGVAPAGSRRSPWRAAGPSTDGRPCRRARTSRMMRRTPWIMTRVLTTAATMPVAANSRIPGVPKDYGSLRLEHGNGTGWREGLTLTGVGSVTVNDLDTDRAAGYALVDVDAGYTFALGETIRLDLSARISNRAARRYSGSVIVNDGNGRYFEPGPNRGFMLGARLTF